MSDMAIVCITAFLGGLSIGIIIMTVVANWCWSRHCRACDRMNQDD